MWFWNERSGSLTENSVLPWKKRLRPNSRLCAAVLSESASRLTRRCVSPFASMLNAQRRSCVVYVSTADLYRLSSKHHNSLSMSLTTAIWRQRYFCPTSDTRDIIATAVKSLDRIWVSGHRYAKASVMLNDFSPTGVSQLNLLDEVQPRPQSDALMKVLDSINHTGLVSVWFAGRGIAPEWQMKREMLSPAYTTRWKEVPVARF